MSQSFFTQYEILPEAQKYLLNELGSVSKNNFVLYGGTAIALRLAHRDSVDFDFFTEDTFTTQVLYDRFAFLKGSIIIQDEKNTLTVIVETPFGEVKVSFFGGLTFGRVSEPQWTNDRILLVAGLEDLFTLKLAVLLKRVEVKDYQDIAAILRSGLPLERGLACARLFYSEFQPSEALKALVYFKGGDLHTLSEDDKQLLIKAVQKVRDLPEVSLSSPTLI
jgi:hypothetical protein